MLHSQDDPEEEQEEENDGKIMIPEVLDKVLKAAKVTIPEIMTFVRALTCRRTPLPSRPSPTRSRAPPLTLTLTLTRSRAS